MARNAKIICTIGPASDTEEKLTKLIKAGMDIARLNFSHGSHEDHLKKIKIVRKISKKLGKPIPIMQDLQGPKIRIGTFEDPPVVLNPGELFTITTEDVQGNDHIVSTTYKSLANDVRAGDTILVNDGLIKLKVMEKHKVDIFCEVVNGGSLYDRRGMNLPGVNISESTLTKKDKKDLAFGIEHGIDWVALSFVRTAENIRDLKKIMGKRQIPIIAKLEKPEALENLSEIIDEAYGIMVARGDLGVEISTERVPVVQKQIIEECRLAGKPVITATQMLDSMMVNPVPTRAEASDVANAIFDGSDAVMLSGETAFGKYPLPSVKMMHKIVSEAEKQHDYFRLNIAEKIKSRDMSFSNSVCLAAYYTAMEIKARCIVVFTETGSTTRNISNLRPCVPIIALTSNKGTFNRMALLWGVQPSLINKKIDVTRDLAILEAHLKENGFVKSGDHITLIAGSSTKVGGTDMLRLHKIS